VGCKAVSGVAAGEEGVDPIVDTFYVTVYLDCIMNSGKDIFRVLKRRKGGKLRGFKGSLKQLCSLFERQKIINLSGDQPTPRWPLDWVGVGYPQGIEW
jgi:hypothetical protein